MSKIKTFFKSIDVAFSIYSKIPMPRFEWGSSDMKYHLCFFPWVGAVIGGLEYLWFYLYGQWELGRLLFLLVAVAIPLLVTGGFHVDGFMDTMDALHSYQSKEKKLEILKDPHIGAFSVICLVIYFLLLIAFGSEVEDGKCVAFLCLMFFASRCLSGISVLSFPSAKKDGMMSMFSSTAQKSFVKWSLIVQLVICLGLMAMVSYILCGITMIVGGLTFLYYYFMSRKQFGGITGDLCGFFVTVLELVVVMAVSICNIIGLF